MKIDTAEINHRFDYHEPNEEKTKTHEDIRFGFKEFASELADDLPESREKSLVFTALEEASFWAHAAVARND